MLSGNSSWATATGWPNKTSATRAARWGQSNTTLARKASPNACRPCGARKPSSGPAASEPPRPRR
eukprot:11947416-Alexandrium_andersonii.AAC.2